MQKTLEAELGGDFQWKLPKSAEGWQWASTLDLYQNLPVASAEELHTMESLSGSQVRAAGRNQSLYQQGA